MANVFYVNEVLFNAVNDAPITDAIGVVTFEPAFQWLAGAWVIGNCQQCVFDAHKQRLMNLREKLPC